MADNGLDKFVTGMLFGAVIGGAVALLLAPKTGSETRQLVRERAGEYIDTARERAGEYVGPARERAGEYIGAARERVQTFRRRNNQDLEEEAIPGQVVEAE